jgi:beta-galactosidase
VDDAGVRVPNADALVTFQIDGPARILGIGSGDLNSIENGKDVAHRTYQGRGLVILRITDPATTVTVKASSPGLESAMVVLSPGGLVP